MKKREDIEARLSELAGALEPDFKELYEVSFDLAMTALAKLYADIDPFDQNSICLDVVEVLLMNVKKRREIKSWHAFVEHLVKVMSSKYFREIYNRVDTTVLSPELEREFDLRRAFEYDSEKIHGSEYLVEMEQRMKMCSMRINQIISGFRLVGIRNELFRKIVMIYTRGVFNVIDLVPEFWHFRVKLASAMVTNCIRLELGSRTLLELDL